MYIKLPTFFFIFECTQSANILGIFPFPSPSHQIVFQTVWRELSLRGHNVTVVTPDPLNDTLLSNLTEISVRNIYAVWKNIKLENVLSKERGAFLNLHLMYNLIHVFDEAVLNNVQFQKLINDPDQKFDLIMIEFFHAVLHSLPKKFQAPVIGISTFGPLTEYNDHVGNPNHQVLYPDFFLSSYGKKLSFWNRVRHVLFGVWTIYYHRYWVVSKAQKLSKKYIDKNINGLETLEKNWSMLCYNSNPLLYPPRANVPLVLEFSQIHIRPAKPLSKDLQQILDEAEEGFVYLSFGSNIKSINLKDNFKKIITETLSELPYKVIWKWESDYLPNKPSNVIARKWLPQQDILAHPNIRVFVIQGGLQSIEEAISQGVPMVGLPFVFDQTINIQKMVDLGISVTLDPFNVTKETLKKSIVEVAENPNYKKRILDVRNLLADKRVKSVEDLVWWIEYVIRHKGTKHLRSPSAEISLFNYLLLDIVCTLIIIIFVLIYSSYKVLKFIL